MCAKETRAHGAARVGRGATNERYVLLYGRTLRRGGRGALNARWTHGHRFDADQAGIVGEIRPVGIRHVQHQRCNGMEGQQESFGAAGIGFVRLLLAGGFLRDLGKTAQCARLAPVEGHVERLGGRHDLRIVVKHLRPSHQLHHIPHRPIGTEPGEEKAGDGNAATHG